MSVSANLLDTLLSLRFPSPHVDKGAHVQACTGGQEGQVHPGWSRTRKDTTNQTQRLPRQHQLPSHHQHMHLPHLSHNMLYAVVMMMMMMYYTRSGIKGSCFRCTTGHAGWRRGWRSWGAWWYDARHDARNDAPRTANVWCSRPASYVHGKATGKILMHACTLPLQTAPQPKGFNTTSNELLLLRLLASGWSARAVLVAAQQAGVVALQAHLLMNLCCLCGVLTIHHRGESPAQARPGVCTHHAGRDANSHHLAEPCNCLLFVRCLRCCCPSCGLGHRCLALRQHLLELRGGGRTRVCERGRVL